MNTRILAGPALVLLYQLAPVDIEPDPVGRYRLTFGYGAGQFEHRQLNCAGDVVSAAPVDFRSLGVQADAWPANALRLTGFGGLEGPGHEELFGGLQAAGEARYVGLGLGVSRSLYAVGDEQGTVYPSVYLRLGDLDGAHFRMDFWHPNPTFGATGVARLGIGFNQGRMSGASGFLGMSVGPYGDESHVGGLFGELYFPLAGGLDLLTAGSWRPSHSYADYGLALGARLNLSR